MDEEETEQDNKIQINLWVSLKENVKTIIEKFISEVQLVNNTIDLS